MVEPKLIERPAGGECMCGRPANKVHCPVCGRMDIYCRVEDTNIISNADGSQSLLRVYRCKTCGIIFNDHDWMLRCVAPFKKKSKRQMLEELVRRQPTYEERQKIVNEKYGGDLNAYARALGRAVGAGARIEDAPSVAKPESLIEDKDSILDRPFTRAPKPATQDSSDLTDEEARKQLAEILREIDEKG